MDSHVIQRIDLFMPPEQKSMYGVLPHFTIKLGEALIRAGVQCRILKVEKDNPKPFLEALYNDPPDCTLSFNGLLPDEQGRFFCDRIKIPHVACLIDSPTQYLVLASSPYTIIVCSDKFSCEFFKGLKCENVFFMPHAVEKELMYREDQGRRVYDITMLSSGIDYEAIAESWPQKYPKVVCDAIYDAIGTVLSDQETSCIQAFIQSMDRHMADTKIGPGIYNYPEIMDQIEMYAKGRDRVELIRAIQDSSVHLFGSGIPIWKKYLGDKTNVTFHEAVNFEKAIEIMKQSKIVLNSCVWLKDGTHERILTGLVCGALVLTNDNIYMREHFKDGENIALYKVGKWDQVNEQIRYYLSHQENMKKIAEKGRELVISQHTWDQRAKILLKELPQALDLLYN